MTREEWLNQAAGHLAKLLAEVGVVLPESVKVSVGWAKRPGKGVGWCYQRSASGTAETSHIFISPEYQDAVREDGSNGVLSILLHELIHASDDCASGHRGHFATVAKALGFEGKMTSTVPGAALNQKLVEIADQVGVFPHDKLVPSPASSKQSTRMLKITCDCGYTLRTTRKWVEYGLPTCPCGGSMETEGV